MSSPWFGTASPVSSVESTAGIQHSQSMALGQMITETTHLDPTASPQTPQHTQGHNQEVEQLTEELESRKASLAKVMVELSEAQSRLLEEKRQRKHLKADLDEALVNVGELAEALELAEGELDMLRPLEDNRQRGIVNSELHHIAQQLEKKFVMCGIECDDEMALFRPKLREMEALNEELYEQVDILKEELGIANRLLGKNDPDLIQLEANRHSALDSLREELAVLKEEMDSIGAQHEIEMQAAQKEGAVRILHRVGARFRNAESLLAIRAWSENCIEDHAEGMKMSRTMILQLWKKVDRMSERAIEQESSVDGWREAVRTQETRAAVSEAHAQQLEQQLAKIQVSMLNMGSSADEQGEKIKQQEAHILELESQLGKKNSLEATIKQQEVEIATLIARLNRELRFSTSNQEAVEADDMRMHKLTERNRVVEAELIKLNQIEHQHRQEQEKSRALQGEMHSLQRAADEAEKLRAAAEAKARALSVELEDMTRRLDILSNERRTANQAESTMHELKEEQARLAAKLKAATARRDELEAELREASVKGEMTSKQAKRLSVLEDLHRQDEEHVKQQKIELQRLQQVEQDLIQANKKLETQAKLLGQLPELEGKVKEQGGIINAQEAELTKLRLAKQRLDSTEHELTDMKRQLESSQEMVKEGQRVKGLLENAERRVSIQAEEISRLEETEKEHKDLKERHRILETEAQQLRPVREQMKELEVRVHRAEQGAKATESQQAKAATEAERNIAKAGRLQQEAEARAKTLEAELQGYKQRSSSQLHKEGEEHARQMKDLRQRCEDMSEQRDQSRADCKKLEQELVKLRSTDSYVQLEAAHAQVEKLTRSLAAVERDNLAKTSVAGSSVAMQERIESLEKQLKKEQGSRQRVSELEQQLERYKAREGTTLEPTTSRGFDSLSTASALYESSLKREQQKLGAQKGSGKDKPKTASTPKKDSRPVRGKSGAGDVTTRSSRSLEEQMEAYWGRGGKKKHHPAPRRSSIDETKSPDHSPGGIPTRSAEWWGSSSKPSKKSAASQPAQADTAVSGALIDWVTSPVRAYRDLSPPSNSSSSESPKSSRSPTSSIAETLWQESTNSRGRRSDPGPRPIHAQQMPRAGLASVDDLRRQMESVTQSTQGSLSEMHHRMNRRR